MGRKKRRRGHVPSYLVRDRDGRLCFHYRVRVKHPVTGEEAVRWIHRLSPHPFDWAESVEAVRADRAGEIERLRLELEGLVQRGDETTVGEIADQWLADQVERGGSLTQHLESFGPSVTDLPE